MLNFITVYKKYLIGVAVAIALFFAFNMYVSNKEQNAYDRGFQAANIAWEKKGKEYVDIIDSEKAQNTALNDKLNVISEQKRKLEEERTKSVIVKQIEYVKSENASKKCFDDALVDLYNKSLGE